MTKTTADQTKLSIALMRYERDHGAAATNRLRRAAIMRVATDADRRLARQLAANLTGKVGEKLALEILAAIGILSDGRE